MDLTKAKAEYTCVRKAREIVESPPVTTDDGVFFKYENLYRRTEPEQFILKLSNGRVWGRNGAVITANDVLITDLSQEFGPAKTDPSKHSVWRRLTLRKPVEIDGSVAVVAAPGGNVYAHWLCDVLPRLLLLKKEGILDKVDKIVMSIGFLEYQIKTLERLGIDPKKIVNSFDDTEFHLRAKTLFVPSYPNGNATVNGWAAEAVRGFFLPKNEPLEKSGRYYVSREKAVGRQVKNEAEVVSFLERQYGFKKIFAEDYSVEQIAGIFSGAECVAGPHGGGFTNLIFCPPGCKVIDIFPPEDFTTYFWGLANAAGLEYAYFFGEGERPTKEKDIFVRNANIRVNLQKLEALLNKLSLAKRPKPVPQ